MKRFVIGLLAVLLGSTGAAAQHFDPEHRHAIEISSGLAPIRAQAFGPDNPNGSGYWERSDKGQNVSNIFCPSINIAYTYAYGERLDIHVIANITSQIYTVNQYPASTQPNVKYDFKANPISRWRAMSGPSVAVMTDVRWKWYRSDVVRLYSSLGLGFVVGMFPPIPFPYISPIGINVGGNHVYGVFELNLSSASSGLLAGIGFRF